MPGCSRLSGWSIRSWAAAVISPTRVIIASSVSASRVQPFAAAFVIALTCAASAATWSLRSSVLVSVTFAYVFGSAIAITAPLAHVLIGRGRFCGQRVFGDRARTHLIGDTGARLED